MNVKNAKLEELIELTKKYPAWDKEEIKRFVHLENEINELLSTKLVKLNDTYHTIVSVAIDNIQVIRISENQCRMHIRYLNEFEICVSYDDASTMNYDYERLEKLLV